MTTIQLYIHNYKPDSSFLYKNEEGFLLVTAIIW